VRKAPRIVWVPRRRRGFIGGRGGAPFGGETPPGGRPTVGTFDVDETKVGSEISFLLIGRFWSMAWPGARWGRALALLAAAAARVVEDWSEGTSFSGGVALAE
jgi:hypothetical protein